MPTLLHDRLRKRSRSALERIVGVSMTSLQCARIVQTSTLRQGRMCRDAVPALVLLAHGQGNYHALTLRKPTARKRLRQAKESVQRHRSIRQGGKEVRNHPQTL